MNSPATESDHTALLFPGQGSQRGDMRETVAVQCPELLELAIAEVGSDPFERVSEGTNFQQPALYCASIAGWKAAASPSADYFAGHSLGELAASAASGAITLEDGLRLAVARGRIMAEAAEAEPGGMLAVLGDTSGSPSLAASLGLTVANDNAPDQVVLSGPREAIAEARSKFKEAGVRTVRLPVAGAFHSPAMAAAAPRFRAVLDEVEVSEPRVGLISSITTRPASDLRDVLALALVRPVRWRETVIGLRDAGVARFFETGPGEVLAGLVRRTLDGVEVGPIPAPAPTDPTGAARV